MFCAPVRSRVDEIDGNIYFLLKYFIFTTLTVNQNRTIISIFFSIHFFFKLLVNKKMDLRSLWGWGGRGCGSTVRSVAAPFPRGLIFVLFCFVHRRHWVLWRVFTVKIQHCKSRNIHTADVSQSSDVYTSQTACTHNVCVTFSNRRHNVYNLSIRFTGRANDVQIEQTVPKWDRSQITSQSRT